MILLFALLATAPEPPVPVPIGSPGNWIKTNDYPRAALKAFAHGATAFTLRVDAEGHVADCTVTESSGNADLDAATCTLVTARAQFKPATDDAGHPIESRYRNRVVWAFPGATPIAAETSQVDLDVEKDGTITSCIDAISPGALANPFGPLCNAPGTGYRLSIIGADGIPLRGRHHVTARTIVTIDGAPPPLPAAAPSP